MYPFPLGFRSRHGAEIALVVFVEEKYDPPGPAGPFGTTVHGILLNHL